MRSGFPFRLGLVVVLVAGAGALALLNFVDRGRRPAPDFAGACTPVTGIVGPEDLEIDDLGRRAFISSVDTDASEGRPRRGGIYVFSVDDPLADGAWRDRTGGAPARFRPIGVSYFSNGEAHRLFVANAAARSVEMFDVSEEGELRLVETFKERRLTSPNDVVATGPRSFYVTNDFDPGRESALGRLQYLFRTASGRVMQFDGVAWRPAAEGLRYANGIAMRRDGKRLYVAETTGAAVRVYDRDPRTGDIAHAKTVRLPAAPDNLNIDHSGSWWIGARPKTLLPPDFGSARAPSASLVYRLDDIPEMSSTAEAIFVDDGERIAASTVAARLGPMLLIGSPIEKKFLICTLS
jgi:arylesterase/paraoxonase